LPAAKKELRLNLPLAGRYSIEELGVKQCRNWNCMTTALTFKMANSSPRASTSIADSIGLPALIGKMKFQAH
jgi:hypothetical protein